MIKISRTLQRSMRVSIPPRGVYCPSNIRRYWGSKVNRVFTRSLHHLRSYIIDHQAPLNSSRLGIVQGNPREVNWIRSTIVNIRLRLLMSKMINKSLTSQIEGVSKPIKCLMSSSQSITIISIELDVKPLLLVKTTTATLKVVIPQL